MRLRLTAKILAFILSGITCVCLADEKPNIVITEYPEVVQELQGAIEAFQKDLNEHLLDAPYDAGHPHYKETRGGKRSKKKHEKK